MHYSAQWRWQSRVLELFDHQSFISTKFQLHDVGDCDDNVDDGDDNVRGGHSGLNWGVTPYN